MGRGILDKSVSYYDYNNQSLKSYMDTYINKVSFVKLVIDFYINYDYTYKMSSVLYVDYDSHKRNRPIDDRYLYDVYNDGNQEISHKIYSLISDIELRRREDAYEQQKKQREAAQAAQQRAAELPTPTEAQQRVAKLRARVGSGGSEEGNGSGSGTPEQSEQAEKLAALRRAQELRTRVGSGGSGAGSGLGSGTTGIRLRTYQAELQEKIRRAWNIPSRSKGLEATFFLSINRAGQVEQGRLVQGSGDARFDESVQRAIKQAQPLPALPEDFTDRTLEVTLSFRDTRQ
jgi:TonB family protein